MSSFYFPRFVLPYVDPYTLHIKPFVRSEGPLPILETSRFVFTKAKPVICLSLRNMCRSNVFDRLGLK